MTRNICAECGNALTGREWVETGVTVERIVCLRCFEQNPPRYTSVEWATRRARLLNPKAGV